MAAIKILLLLGVLVISGCASMRVAGQVQSGRQALLAGEPERALAYFQEAASGDANYIYQAGASGLFRQSVWTYLGRAQYRLGMLQSARQSLERALSVYDDDYLARMYLGLTLARLGNPSESSTEIQTGMKGLYDWLEHMEYSRPFEASWDPGREIRSEIEKNLAMISGKDIDWDELIASGEWLGTRIEEEVEYVRRDERRRRDRRLRPGVSLGVGVGF